MTLRSAWLAASLTIAALAAPGVATAARCGARRQAGLHLPRLPRHPQLQECVPRLQRAEARRAAPALPGRGAQGIREPRSQPPDDARSRRHDVGAGPAGHHDLPGRPATGVDRQGRGHGAQGGQTCVACHGNDGVGLTPDYPNLAGQHEDYIRQALHSYKSGVRKNAIMSGMAAPLTEKDIDELAAYYSSQRPTLCATDEIRKHGKCPGP